MASPPGASGSSSSSGGSSSGSSSEGLLTPEDHALLVKHFGKGDDGRLDPEELKGIVQTAGEGKLHKLDPSVVQVLKKLDLHHDHLSDDHKLQHLKHQVSLTETQLRYAGYSMAFARAARYLAFTSDFGEALRPVVAARVVKATYAVAFGYCGADIAWEAWKLKRRNYMTEDGVPMSMAQLLVERTAFQGIASIGAPFLIIHSTVDVSKRLFRRMGRFTRWGPSLMGLAVIPLLPLYLDEAVEHGVEGFFHHYGPWAKPQHPKQE